MKENGEAAPPRGPLRSLGLVAAAAPVPSGEPPASRHEASGPPRPARGQSATDRL